MKVFKNMFFVVLIILLAVFLFACQPTPEVPPIVNRGQGLSEEFVIPLLSEMQIKEIDAPDHITETWVSATGGIQINTDADVIVPNISNTPIVELSQKGFTDQMLKELINYFVGGDKLYKIPHMTQDELSLKSTNVVAFNAPDHTWMVPAWLFETERYWMTDAGEVIYSGTSNFIINAVDGGYISPTLNSY